MKPALHHFKRGLAPALAAAMLVAGCGKDKARDDQPDQIYEVVRGDFNVVITASGVLDAVKRYDVQAPSVSKQGLDIIEAVPDQTLLKKGDLIVAFSEESYLDELEIQNVKIEEAENNLMILEQDYQMKIADIVSAIKAASDNHRVSREVLEKYVGEDAPLEKQNLQQALEAARQAVDAEEQNLVSLKASLLSAAMGDESDRISIEGEVDASEMNVENLESRQDQASYDLRIFKQYTLPQQSRKLEQALVKAEMDLQKQLVNSAAQRLQIEGKILTQQRLLKSFEQQRADLLKNISLLRVMAPVSGTITYGDPRRRSSSQQKEIQVGTQMNRGEMIGSIPDLSQLVVNVDVPEISRSKINLGMRAEMRIKALPNLRLSGVIDRISDMASNLIYWDRSSPKIYPTVICLDQNDPLLRPGMTVEVDMISEVIAGVIFVPVEALFVREGEVYCQVKKAVGAEERQVIIGRSSSSFVEVLEGLDEGDRVLLSREEL
jgi:multidrug resistance efflux pump